MTTPDRREFLAASALSLAAYAAADEKAGPVIDTHTHFYDPTRPEGVPWPGKDDKLLYRQVLPAEFKALAKPLGVTGTVVVEASPRVEDNQWLLDLAKDDPFLVGVVGRLTPGADNFAKHLERFAKDPLFRGIRVNAGEVTRGLESKGFRDDLKRLADADRELDVNGGPETPAVVARLAGAVRGLRIVINHAANVRIDGKAPPDDWLKGMRRAAAAKGVWCKVSALVEGTGKSDGSAPKKVDHYRPVLDALWELWGEDRLIYGSNWPVSARFADYATVLGIVRTYFEAKGKAAAAKFFAANAKAAYRWPAR